ERLEDRGTGLAVAPLVLAAGVDVDHHRGVAGTVGELPVQVSVARDVVTGAQRVAVRPHERRVTVLGRRGLGQVDHVALQPAGQVGHAVVAARPAKGYARPALAALARPGLDTALLGAGARRRAARVARQPPALR